MPPYNEKVVANFSLRVGVNVESLNYDPGVQNKLLLGNRNTNNPEIRVEQLRF